MNLTLFELYIPPWVVIPTIIVIIAFIIISIIYGTRAHRFKISAGKEDMIGKSARVLTALAPKGMVSLEGEQWTAISESGRIEPEEEVTVTRIDGLKVYVTRKQ